MLIHGSSNRQAVAILVFAVVAVIASHRNSRLLASLEVTARNPQAAEHIPIGYDPQPAYPALRVHGPRIGRAGFRAGFTSRARSTIIALQYAAIVESVGWRVPVRVLRSEVWSVQLRPNIREELESTWLDETSLEELIRTSSGPIQMYLSPIYAQYVDGTEWRTSIDTSAWNHIIALGIQR